MSLKCFSASPWASSTLIARLPVARWGSCLVVQYADNLDSFLVTMILSKRASSDVIITWMRPFLCVFAVQSTCSRRIFDFKGKCVSVANLSYQSLTYLLPEAFIKVTNDLSTFHTLKCSFMSFPALLRAQSVVLNS